MERIDGLLPDAEKITGGSSASRSKGQRGENGPRALRLDDRICRHCGRELEAEFTEFPPGLQRKYGKTGQWYYHPCTPECERKNDQLEWESARREARVEALRERSGLSKRMRNYGIHNFEPYANPPESINALEKVENYLKNWEENRELGKGLYFCGGVGTGKTHLAVAVMNNLIMRWRVPSLFVTVPEFLDNLRGTYNDPGRDLDVWMDAVKNADFLVLDDLGSERPSAWVQERIFVVVNHRYREALPTVFTSNIGPEALPAQLGERTASRIISMTEGVSLYGDDYRETTRHARSGD